MKSKIESLLKAAVAHLQAAHQLPSELSPTYQIERTRDKQHGDFASNLAMMLAKPAGLKPRDLAQQLVNALPADPAIQKTEIAGPGFINFYLQDGSQYQIVPQILSQGAKFGHSKVGAGQYIQVEFVSANPTGPLHVGHGRGAAYGATLANLLDAVGFRVHREYYVNDAGRQMNILATSVWLRYLELCGVSFNFPSNGYKGGYILEISQAVLNQAGQTWLRSVEAVFQDIPADEPAGGDKEEHIDSLIERAKQLLGKDGYKVFFDAALDSILGDIRDDLREFGVEYTEWFSEMSLTDSGSVQRAIDRLQTNGKLYEKDGAIWFRSTEYGDDKDRVVARDNGQTTYFASDIAYHMNKFERGFDRVINVWGADHHGYIARVKAALSALGYDPEKLTVLLVQFAILYRGGERVQMSTRSGSFVTLRELREEVGNDAARFFYVTRKSEQHMDFDLDLAKSQSKDNPIYYIQYAHARVCSILKKAAAESAPWDRESGLAHLHLLDNDYEQGLLNQLAKYPELLERAALQYEPHQLAQYLRDLAGEFHSWYNAHKVIIEDANLRNARLTLSEAIRQVINNGLTLLGVSAPESM
ncbi:Arginyl-tRNA synthetase [gamma proteobacterium HdN1]|nr:Arginyl-tRNA synthetase [gamma proteobacterium HdN1]